MRDRVGPGNFHDRLATLTASQGVETLMRRELGIAPHLYTPRPGALSALARPAPDQLPLELGQTTEDRQHQPAVRSGCVGPGVAQ